MFDIGWSEMAIIMLLALIIIGPKDLPRVARTIGQWVRKGRMLAREFQTSLEDMAKEAELDDVKKEIEKIGRTDLKSAVENTIDPKGDLKKAFDTSNGASDDDTVGKTLNGTVKADADAQLPPPPAKAEEQSASAEPTSKAKAATKTTSASTRTKTAASKKKPSTAAKKPASTARKTAAPKARAVKKPAAPRKRTAKPAKADRSDPKAGTGDTPSADDGSGGAAMVAESS